MAPGRAADIFYYAPNHAEDALERIIGNLDKVKLKLDEAFFYLDEIEELIQEEAVEREAGEKVSRASERLSMELASLSGKVVELQGILQVLQEQSDTGAAGGRSAGGERGGDTTTAGASAEA